MSKILAPAIERAEEGFPLSEVVAYYWGKNADVLSGFENFASTFLVDGRAPRKGEVFRNPDLAKTYRTLATDGRDAFYEGALAETMDAYMERLGGFLDADDLRAHRSTWVRPVTTNYRGYDVWELPPNGQGIAALSLLNLLEGYDVAAMGYDSPQFIHTFVEAKKLVFADRAKYYADPGFAEVPVNELVSKSYADDRRKLIGGRAAKAVDPGNPALAHGDTVYLTVADEAGNMVSLIQSNYRGMGSGLVPDGLGFVFQDRGQLFDLKPGRANSYAPGKRPFHTIIPAFVSKDGKAWMSFGVMGGPVQPQMHAQVLINIIDFGMGIQEAGDAARFVHAGSGQPTGEVMGDGGVVLVESGVSRATVRALQRKGHKVETRAGGYGGYQAIAVDAAQGVYIGASESRKDGYAAGY